MRRLHHFETSGTHYPPAKQHHIPQEWKPFPIVKPTRCTNVSNLFFWSNILHVSDGLSVHHQEFKTVHTATGIKSNRHCYLLTSKQIAVSLWLLYVQSWTPDDGRKDRPTFHPKHVQCYYKKINLRHWCIWLVLL